MKRRKDDFGLFPRFKLGNVAFYMGPDEDVPAEITNELVTLSLGRHLMGDWGDVDQECWKENDRNLFAVKAGVVRSVYNFSYNGALFLATTLEAPETEVGYVTYDPKKWD